VIILQTPSFMEQLVADRFLSSGAAWIDLATAEHVRVHIARAGSAREQMAWNIRCAALANLRHTLINPLIDYGLADAGRTFETYATHGAAWAGGAPTDALLTHATAFLEAHGIALTPPVAGLVLRVVSAGSSRVRSDQRNHAQKTRPLGIVLQRRAAFDAIADALDGVRPGGACAVSIAGEVSSGLRTLRLITARIARLKGYVPVAPLVLQAYPWIVERLLARHVCVIADDPRDGDDQAIVSLLMRLSSASPRRHLVLSFVRPTGRSAPSLRIDPMGMRALASMVFVDRRQGPSPDQVFDAARRSEGRPGQFLAHLGADLTGPGRGAALVAHETAQPYVVTVTPAAVARRGRTAGLLGRALERANGLARAGRHASAWRLLSRAIRLSNARGELHEAARCSLCLGWLALDRARIDAAIHAFEQARALCPGGRTGVIATIGLGVAWTDDGKLVEAEAALRTSMMAAGSVANRAVIAQAAAGLGRCLYWQGRYDEAAAALGAAAGTADSSAEAARAVCTMARVHLAEGAVASAVRGARQALDLAIQTDEPRIVSSAYRVLATAVSAAGDPHSAGRHIRDGLRVATAAHLPLAASRLRLTWADLEIASGTATGARRAAERVAGASHYPRLLRFHARVVLSRATGAGLDADTRTFIAGSGAVGISRTLSAAAANPVADLEALLDLGHTASDDRSALDGICTALLNRLRAASILVAVPAPERRILAVCGRPWHGDPGVAWRALACGASIVPDQSAEPCQAAEALRYGGEVIGALAARWTAGTVLDAARAAALMRVGALAMAANVRALLDRAAPESSAPAWQDLLGDSPPTRSLRDAIARAARAPFPVLVEGESGSGKELVAHAIHRLSARRDRRFCALNCAALSDDLLEAELFGHARGAFTGAIGERAGLFEEADGGTLFLDEIGELSGRAQAKLLRALQDGEVRRVGENLSRRVDARIVAATNRRLEQEVAGGRFRADLRFRLDVVRIEVPPLRDRASDVPLLASRFWSDAAARVGSQATLSPDVIAALARYDWPGNVRELQNVMAWMAVHSPRRGRVGVTALPRHFAQASVPSGGSFGAAREEFERRFVKAALASANGQRPRAAAALGVTRQGLAKMLRRLGLERP
jgi:DNA-binding NtrC family response regulator/tetratricopeptide (TPR) repeat protein